VAFSSVSLNIFSMIIPLLKMLKSVQEKKFSHHKFPAKYWATPAMLCETVSRYFRPNSGRALSFRNHKSEKNSHKRCCIHFFWWYYRVDKPKAINPFIKYVCIMYCNTYMIIYLHIHVWRERWSFTRQAAAFSALHPAAD
jgi:hypothetical protein